jgi:GDSL-like Lipase/Acylhydrolase family/Bacterial Ig-like domain (group 3)
MARFSFNQVFGFGRTAAKTGAPERGSHGIRPARTPSAHSVGKRTFLSFAVITSLVCGAVNALVPGVSSAQVTGPTVLGPAGATDGCVLSASGSVTLTGQAIATVTSSGSFVYSGAKCQLTALDFTVPTVPSGEILVWEPWQSGDRNHHQRLYISAGVLYYSYFEGAYGVPYESNLTAIGPVVSGSRIQIDPFAARARTCETGSTWKQIASFNTYPVFSSGQPAVFDFQRSTFGYWTGSGATPIGGGGGYQFDNTGGGCGTPVLQTTVLTGPTVLGPADATDGCQLVVAGGTVTLTGQAIASIASSGSVLFTGAKCQLSALDITVPLAPSGGEILSWDPWQSGDRNHHQRLYISGGVLYYSYFEGAYGVPYESYLTAIGPVVSGSRFQIDPFGARARTCEAGSSWKSIAAFNSYPVFTSGQSAVFDFQRSTLGYYSGGSATPIGGSGGYSYDNATGGCGTPVLQTTLLNGPTFLDPPGAIDGCKLGVAGGTVTFTANAISSITSSGSFVYSGVKCQLGALDFTMPVAPAGGEILVWDQWYGNDRQHHPRLYVSAGILYFSYSESAYGVHYESYLTAIGPVVNGSRVQIDPINARIRTCETGSTWKQMFGFNSYPIFTSGQSAVFDFQRSTFGYGVNGVSSTEPFEYSDANGGCKTPTSTLARATTTTNLISQTAPWSADTAGTLTASITTTGTSAVTGTIELREGTAVLSSQPVGANGVTSFSVTLPAGPHALTAVFIGTATNSPSTSSPVTINALATSGILAGDPANAPCWVDSPTAPITGSRTRVCGVQLTAQPNGTFLNAQLYLNADKNNVVSVVTQGVVTETVAGGYHGSEPANQDSMRFKVLNSSATVTPSTSTYLPTGAGGFSGIVGTVSDRTKGGTISVQVWADLNRNGTFDSSEPTQTLTGRWRRPAAFGDSYSSGEGAPSGYDPESNTGANNCHRYPKAYARQLNLPAQPQDTVTTDVRLYACSGARTYNLLSSVDVANNKLSSDDLSYMGNVNPSVNPRDITVFGPELPGGPNTDVRGNVEKRQFLTAAAENVTPDYVTVGIGGNDFRFADLISDTCAAIRHLGNGCTASTPFPMKTPNDRKIYPNVKTLGQFYDLHRQIVFDRVDRVVKETKTLYPGVPVFLVGYPMLFTATINPLQGFGCTVAALAFNGSRAYFRSQQFLVDTGMSNVAANNGVHFVSLLSAYDSGDHGICGGGGAAINDLAFPGTDSVACQTLKTVQNLGGGFVSFAAVAVLGVACYINIAIYARTLVPSLRYLQSAFHPNDRGQKIDADTISAYVNQWTGPRTADNVPQNPAPIAVASNAVTTVNQATQSNPATPFAIARFGSFAINIQTTAPTPFPLQYSVQTPSCQASPGDALTIRADGFNAQTATPAKITNAATGEIIATVPLTYDSTQEASIGTFTLPSTNTTQRLALVSGATTDVSSPLFVLGTGPVPCANDDEATAPAGIATTISVAANDTNNAGATIGEVSAAHHGTVVVNGTDLVYTPNRFFTGDDTIDYQLCGANGCTGARIFVSVTRIPCTITSTGNADLLNGTPGDDVICVNDAVTKVNAGAGNDIVYINGPLARVDPGPGIDRVITDGNPALIVTSSEGADTVIDKYPYLRVSNGVLPTVQASNPTGTTTLPDTTNPTLSVTVPASILTGETAVATITCTDDTPGVTCPATVALDTTTTGQRLLIVEAIDASGNKATVRYPYQVTAPDTTPPTVTGNTDRPPNTAGWFNKPVTVQWTATDPAPSSGPPSQPPAQTITTEGKNQTITSANSCDPRNNCAVGVITLSIDTTPPTITVTGNTGIYAPTDTLAIQCTTTDALSGIATHTCTNINGIAASFGAGPHTVVMTATDTAGNTTTQNVTFTVSTPTNLVKPSSCSVEFDVSKNNGTTFVGQLQINNKGTALPLWHLTWNYRANEQATGIANGSTGGIGTNALLYTSGPTADIYGYGTNLTFRAGDSLRNNIWVTGTWPTTATAANKPNNFTLNGTLCTANIHGTRYDK